MTTPRNDDGGADDRLPWSEIPRLVLEKIRTLDAMSVGAAVVAFVLAGALVGAVVLGRTATYEARALVAVDQPLLLSSGGDGVVDKLSRLRLKYAPLLRTDEMTLPLASELDLAPDRVRGRVDGALVPNSLLISVAGRGADAASAIALANAASAYLGAYAQDEQVAIDVPPVEQYTLEVVSQARFAAKIAPSNRRALSLGVVGGLLAGAAAFVLARQRVGVTASNPE